MKKKMNLEQLKVKSFITEESFRAGALALAAAPERVVAGETLNEDPCTLDTMGRE